MWSPHEGNGVRAFGRRTAISSGTHFNGAVARRQSGLHEAVLHERRLAASMRPPHEGSGATGTTARQIVMKTLQWGRRTRTAESHSPRARKSTCPWNFNGVAAQRQRSESSSRGESKRASRFNQATARMQRNVATYRDWTQRTTRLKWSRRTNAAEWRPRRATRPRTRSRFNGAAARMQRSGAPENRIHLEAPKKCFASGRVLDNPKLAFGRRSP